jgi:hypothetical protein
MLLMLIGVQYAIGLTQIVSFLSESIVYSVTFHMPSHCLMTDYISMWN